MPYLINAYSTFRRTPTLDFPHELNNRRDRSDPELAEHLQGFMGYILQNGREEMTQQKYHLLRHIERVQNHLSLMWTTTRWRVTGGGLRRRVRFPSCPMAQSAI